MAKDLGQAILNLKTASYGATKSIKALNTILKDIETEG